MIGRIRRENGVYREGDFELIDLNNESLIFKRTEGDDELITVANTSSKEFLIEFSDEVTDLINNAAAKSFVIKPETALIFKSKNNIILKV